MIQANIEAITDLIPDKDQAKFIVNEREILTKEIEELKVGNRDQYEKGLNLGIANNNVLNRLKDLVKALTMPYEVQIKTIKDKFKPIIDQFEQNDGRVRGLLERYQNTVNVENIKTIHTDMGRATIQERSVYEITDEKKIPKEYWKLDETKIGRVIRGGGSIPGVKAVKSYSTAFYVNGGDK